MVNIIKKAILKMEGWTLYRDSAYRIHQRTYSDGYINKCIDEGKAWKIENYYEYYVEVKAFGVYARNKIDGFYGSGFNTIIKAIKFLEEGVDSKMDLSNTGYVNIHTTVEEEPLVTYKVLQQPLKEEK